MMVMDDEAENEPYDEVDVVTMIAVIMMRKRRRRKLKKTSYKSWQQGTMTTMKSTLKLTPKCSSVREQART